MYISLSSLALLSYVCCTCFNAYYPSMPIILHIFPNLSPYMTSLVVYYPSYFSNFCDQISKHCIYHYPLWHSYLMLVVHASMHIILHIFPNLSPYMTSLVVYYPSYFSNFCDQISKRGNYLSPCNIYIRHKGFLPQILSPRVCNTKERAKPIGRKYLSQGRVARACFFSPFPSFPTFFSLPSIFSFSFSRKNFQLSLHSSLSLTSQLNPNGKRFEAFLRSSRSLYLDSNRLSTQPHCRLLSPAVNVSTPPSPSSTSPPGHPRRQHLDQPPLSLPSTSQPRRRLLSPAIIEGGTILAGTCMETVRR